MKIWGGGRCTEISTDHIIKILEPSHFSPLARQGFCSAPNHPPSRSCPALYMEPGSPPQPVAAQSPAWGIARPSMGFNKGQGARDGRWSVAHRLSNSMNIYSDYRCHLPGSHQAWGRSQLCKSVLSLRLFLIWKIHMTVVSALKDCCKK